MSQTQRRLSFATDFKVPHPSFGSGTKQMMDVFIAMMALLILAPLFVLESALIRATSRGPALFRQQRVGSNGEPSRSSD